MPASGDWVTVGIDNGGTANNGTVLDADGTFLIAEMAELPSLVREGPDKAITALVDSFDKVLAMTGVPREKVRAVGLDTPGPASADGVLVTGGATNFGHPGLVQVQHQGWPWKSGSAFPSCTTTTATPPPSTPTTCGTARTPRRAARCPRLSAPGSAAA